MILETNTTVTLKIDYLNLGNNFTFSHLIQAIKDDESAMDNIDELMSVDLDKLFTIESELNYSHSLKEHYCLDEFLDNFVE